MQISIDNKVKYISVWLSHQDMNNPDTEIKIQKIVEEYKPKKYRVVVFESGNRDLLECTADLLVHNKRVANTK